MTENLAAELDRCSKETMKQMAEVILGVMDDLVKEPFMATLTGPQALMLMILGIRGAIARILPEEPKS